MNSCNLSVLILAILTALLGSGCEATSKLRLNSNRTEAQSVSACDELQVTAFANSYHPVLVKNCGSCHSENGKGSGAFADEDKIQLAFGEFSVRTANITHKGLSASHQAPFTGPHLADEFEAAELIYANSKTQVDQCYNSSRVPANDDSDSQCVEETEEVDESKIFRETIYPFLVKNCKNCHTQGGSGNGAFADGANPEFAFEEYSLRERQVIVDRALDANHQRPFTGPQHSAELTSILSQIDARSTNIDADATTTCDSDADTNTNDADSNTDNILDPGESVYTTMGKATPQTQNPTTLAFNLPSEFVGSASVSAFTFAVDVKVHTSVSDEKTYHLSAPRITANGQSILVSRVEVFLNGSLVTEATGYKNRNVRVPANRTRDLSTSTVILNRTPTAGDRISFGFGVIEDIDFDPPTFSQLIAQGGIFDRNCSSCHSGANPSAGLNISDRTRMIGFNHVVPNNDQQGTVIERMQDSSAPMPPAGVLSDDDLQSVRDWLLDGARE